MTPFRRRYWLIRTTNVVSPLLLPLVRVTVATKRLNGFFREIELLENRIFNLLCTIYFNYPTFNASHVLRSTKNASKD
jgi:hypothetical protein